MNELEKKNLYRVAFQLFWKYNYWSIEQAMDWCLKIERARV